MRMIMRMNGKPVNIYLSHVARERLDALRKRWGNLSRGKAIERLLEIWKTKKKEPTDGA